MKVPFAIFLAFFADKRKGIWRIVLFVNVWNFKIFTFITYVPRLSAECVYINGQKYAKGATWQDGCSSCECKDPAGNQFICTNKYVLYSTIAWVLGNFCVSYPNCVSSRVKCICNVGKRVNRNLASIDPCYNEQCYKELQV